MIPQPTRKLPLWFIAILIVSVLPVFQTPWLLSASGSDLAAVRMLVWGYPAYTLLSVWLAGVCYSRYRTALAWILLAVSWLSAVAIAGIVETGGTLSNPL